MTFDNQNKPGRPRVKDAEALMAMAEARQAERQRADEEALRADSAEAWAAIAEDRAVEEHACATAWRDIALPLLERVHRLERELESKDRLIDRLRDDRRRLLQRGVGR